MHEIIEPKLDDNQCGFRPSRSTYRQTFHSPASFREILEILYAQDVYAQVFSFLRKHACHSRGMEAATKRLTHGLVKQTHFCVNFIDVVT